MSAITSPVSDMLITVKSREVQRALQAEMRGDRTDAKQHFLAAAHLELVLAKDYEAAGDVELASRSRISAASCFWRAGQAERGREVFAFLAQNAAVSGEEVQQLIAGLSQNYGNGE